MVLGFEKGAERLHVSHEVISLSWPLGINQILEVEPERYTYIFKVQGKNDDLQEKQSKTNKTPNK